MTRVAIAVGSNVGDRAAHLDYAVARLSIILSSITVSRWYETAPVGVGEQPLFLNGAIVGDARLSPRELLDALLAIERGRRRQRPHPGAPRTLDLDLILYGDRIIDEPGLIVPHPRFRERRFVLEPLAEIAPELIDPVTNTSVRDVFERFLSA